MKTIWIIGATLISLSLTNLSYAENEDALDIITKAFDLKRVDDQISKLTFHFSAPDKKEQQVIYTMVWKNMHGKKGYDTKAMFFTEFPPDKKGIAYLGWLKPAGSETKDDEWIYLPELRMTRRIAHRDHDHSHDDDEFGNSILKREHLEPRPPHLDTHELIAERSLNGGVHFIIASTPKLYHGHSAHQQHNAEQSGKVIYWIDKQTYRTNRIQFFNQHNQQTLDMEISWAQLEDYWLWQTITAINPGNKAKTVLEISDTRINTGLKDRTFSKRSLEKGPERLN